MERASPSFPNEVWMRVFSYIADIPSLKAVNLTSRRFHRLGMDELLRALSWKTEQKALSSLEFWERNMNLAYIPISLSITLRSRDDPATSTTYPAILNHVSAFKNLGSLSISNASLPPTIYRVLLTLSHLTRLDLQSCYVPDAPPHFPFSYPSFWDQDLDGTDIASGVTHLSLRNVARLPPAAAVTIADLHAQIDLFNHLPHLAALTLDYLQSAGPPVFAHLTALTLLPAYTPNHTVGQLNMYLPAAHSLVHLTVGAPAMPGSRDGPPTLAPTAPLLQTLAAPEFVARALVPNAPALAALTVNTPLAAVADALALIEGAPAATLHTLELSLDGWDDEVLLAVTQCLPACRRVALTFRFGAPTADFVFNLGVEHLPRLAHLHTLHLHPRAPDPRAERPGAPALGFGFDDDDDYDDLGIVQRQETRVAAEPPAEAVCAEALAAWTRYNPALRAVRFDLKREWARTHRGGRWALGGVEE
ncbi:hypothetical protein B0H15DRAFT_858734 [Mycena belliarum]|uniref:F-box domain-containing protein n=1 Tax=Mycena belliarum TaxID=1033014 RepID=A0AAD6TW37_9AGAR|nr:hypothetical protein B0H15DRAFT_858734 [Mycena belliae]